MKSESIQWIYRLGVLFFVAATATFYFLQNQPDRLGGAISLPKACWLALAVFYWYFFPAILISDKFGKNKKFYTGLKLFYLSMLVRAFFELYLMYASQAWHYAYGIAHNIFSLGILLALLIAVKSRIEQLLKTALYVMMLMFVAEIYFASYMIVAVKDGYENTIWFVDGSPEHWFNNGVTTVMVFLLIVWQIIFYYQWIKIKKKAG